MLGTAHMLIGAAIGKTLESTELTIPLAFLSHFVCDAIPHSDFPGITGYFEHGITRKNFPELILKSSEPVLGAILTTFLAYNSQGLFLPIFLGGFFACFPDILEFFLRELRLQKAIDFLEKYHNNSKKHLFGYSIQIIFSITSIAIILY